MAGSASSITWLVAQLTLVEDHNLEDVLTASVDTKDTDAIPLLPEPPLSSSSCGKFADSYSCILVGLEISKVQLQGALTKRSEARSSRKSRSCVRRDYDFHRQTACAVVTTRYGTELLD
jgi:hypothetical protein